MYIYTKSWDYLANFLSFAKFRFKYYDFNEKSHKGYITFQNSEDVLKAKNELERKVKDDFQLQISFSPNEMNFHTKSDHDFSDFLDQAKNKSKEFPLHLKKGNDSSIFVFDFPPLVDEGLLQDFFRAERIKIKTRMNSINKRVRYAIVTFRDRESAVKAIDENNYVKFDGQIVRLALADDETRRILSTNKGKIRISNIDPEIEVSQLHVSLDQFGEIVEAEIPSENGQKFGYGYLQFRNEKTAKELVVKLKGGTFDGRPFEIELMNEKVAKNDPSKLFLYKTIKIKPKLIQSNRNKDLNINSIFNDFQIYSDNNDRFRILVDDREIECSKLNASFLSPIIAAKNQDEESFTIKVLSLNHNSSKHNEIVSYLSDLLSRNPTKKELKNQLFQITKEIVVYSNNNKLNDYLNQKAKELNEYIHEGINEDYLLNFILLIEIFTQFGNNFVIQFSMILILNQIKSNRKKINERSLLIRLEIKNIMKDTDENQEEIEFICKNFAEMDPSTLNEIDMKIIEKAIQNIELNDKKEDKFLYQILRLDDSYKQYFVDFVDFTRISNKAMIFFLTSIDFSFINEQILGCISVRLCLPFSKEIAVKNKKRIQEEKCYSSIIENGIQNSIRSQKLNENKKFNIFVNDRQIELNKYTAFIISPSIKNNLEADITFSSFHIDLHSQIEFINLLLKSLTYFLPQKVGSEFICDSFENMFCSQIRQMIDVIENDGFCCFADFIRSLPSNETNPLNFTIWISIFINLGNLKISEFLVNSVLKLNDNKNINNETLCERIHHKDILKYNNLIDIDQSSEREYIGLKFDEIFEKFLSFNDIDEIHWKIIAIRLSINVETQ